MVRHHLAVVMLLCLSCGGMLECGAQQSKTQETEEDRLRGRWRVIYAEHDGKPAKEETTFTFEQPGHILTKIDGTYPMVRRYRLDASKKTLDIEWSVASKGTYVLDGNTLVHRFTIEYQDQQGKLVWQTFLRVFRRD
jgi:uncharacterized protein (TIGR03067 family)